MTDYIEREAAVNKLTVMINESGKYTAYESGLDDAAYMIEHEIPAVDVVPVVRCKDCICFHPIGTSKHNGDCDKHYERVQYNDFCSWAENKNGDRE